MTLHAPNLSLGGNHLGRELLSLCLAWFVVTATTMAVVQEPAPEPVWTITAECQMIVLPQKLALPLIADFTDDAKVDAAWARVQRMIAEEQATLLANLIVRGRAGERAASDSSEEVQGAGVVEGVAVCGRDADEL